MDRTSWITQFSPFPPTSWSVCYFECLSWNAGVEEYIGVTGLNRRIIRSQETCIRRMARLLLRIVDSHSILCVSHYLMSLPAFGKLIGWKPVSNKDILPLSHLTISLLVSFVFVITGSTISQCTTTETSFHYFTVLLSFPPLRFDPS